jgi:diguanylate cyclase (GGDEF)-like protein
MPTSLLDNRVALGVRRLLGRFGVRLALSVVLALSFAEGLTYWAVSHDLERQQIREAAGLHHADAAVLVQVAADSPTRRVWLREVTEQLRAIERRDGTSEAIVVNRRFRVVAAGDAASVGRTEKTSRLISAFGSGRAWGGHQLDQRSKRRDFEYVHPLTIHGQAYALEIVSDGEFFDGQLASIRKQMLIAAALALITAGALFWLSGGQRVLRMHRFALERATRDGLTDLLNHRAFQDALRRAGEAAQRYGEDVALALIDLDGFKAENDRHGHRHGDRRLQSAALALAGGRTSDLVFRVGGDEFAVLLSHTDTVGARRGGNRLHTRLEDEQIAASIGVGVLRPGQSPFDLLDEVAAALCEAKRTGGDRVVMFDQISHGVAIITGERRDALSRLVANDGVDVVFQPIWDLRADRLLGVEALARPHAQYGFTGPAEAFDAAHQLGCVHALDRLCVDRVLARAPEIPGGALLFINLSPKTLELDADGSHWFIDCIVAARLNPERVVVEVTERFGSRTESVVESVRYLREQGFKIAIDDMGTGNSGLEMLRELKPDYVKLDRSVVVGAITDSHARGVLMGVTAFAHETGAFVIAEGIEDQEVLDFVKTLPIRAAMPHIDGGQGYGLGRPSTQIPTAHSVRPAPPRTARHSPSRVAALTRG